MTSITLFLISVIITLVFFIIDGISHQKFNKRKNIFFHAVGIPIYLVFLFILAINEFNYGALIYPGIFVIAMGLLISFKGLIEIKENLLKAKKVYKKGLYLKIRHPIYLGLIISLFGFGLIVNSVTFYLYIIFNVIMFIWLALYEEKYLEKKFPEYKQYKEKTGIFIPRFNVSL